MADLFSTLFNDGGLKVKPTENPQEESNQFKPRFSKGQNKRYEAIIRFLPNPEDPVNKSTISKWSVFLRDPRTKQGKTIDSPSSNGEADPLSQMFFALRNSSNKYAVECSDNFKRHQRFYSLVQVIENQAEPNLVGKILVWCYGPKIKEKIDAEQRPMMQGVEPNQPFDLFKGRLFKVIAVEQSGFNNLDQSMFFEIGYPANCMRITVPTTDPTTGQTVTQVVPATREMASTDAGRQAILNYLTTNAPKLSPFEYTPWTPDQKQYVDEMILLHSQILAGEVPSSPQQNATVSQMSMNQVPNTSATPQVQSLGSVLNANTMTNPTPAATPTLDTPLPTLGLSAVNPTPTPSVPNMGGVTGVNVTDLGSIMGSTPTTPTPSAGPTSTNLGDILGDVLIQ